MDLAPRPVIDPIGGQAVIEGVMMRSNTGVSIAVRSPEGNVVVRYQAMIPWRERHQLLKLPLVRGVVTLFDSVLVGWKMLEESAAIALGEEEAGPPSQLGMLAGIAVAVGLFAVVPAFVYTHLPAAWTSTLLRSLVEGLVRLSLFVGYLLAIGMIPDVKRLFEYHGAEHQVIKCHEAGLELKPANARGFSPLHPRCGTSFLLVTVLVGILVFAFLPRNLPLALRVVSKIALLPLVAGISFELIKLAGKAGREGAKAGFWAKLALALTTPGLWLQRITTRPASDEMLEVAIASLNCALAGPTSPSETSVP